MRFVCFTALVAFAAFPVAAATPMKIGEFSCVQTLDDVYDLELTKDRVRVNNFTLAPDTYRDTPRLQLSASGSNRTQKSIKFSVEVIGYNSKNEGMFAITARPMMGFVGVGKTEEVNGEIYASPQAALKNASKFCIRVFGDF